jgi:signal transduction histidine kinase
MAYTRLIWFTLAGIIIGYLLMHPFAMLAYALGPMHPLMATSAWHDQMHSAFSTEMLTMGGAFAFMGGIAGFAFGAWSLQKERLMAEKLESQRRLAALDTLRDLMVTLAHHIRNSNLVIGGFSSHLLKHLEDPEFRRQLTMVQKASQEIEAVIESLENLTRISTVDYTTNGQAKMIDLKTELEALLGARKAPKEEPHES